MKKMFERISVSWCKRVQRFFSFVVDFDDPRWLRLPIKDNTHDFIHEALRPEHFPILYKGQKRVVVEIFENLGYEPYASYIDDRRERNIPNIDRAITEAMFEKFPDASRRGYIFSPCGIDDYKYARPFISHSFVTIDQSGRLNLCLSEDQGMCKHLLELRELHETKVIANKRQNRYLANKVINLEQDPFTPEGLAVISHTKEGKPKFKELYLGLTDWVKKDEVYLALLHGQHANANLLDFLLTHRQCIPQEFEDKVVCFMGTEYSFPNELKIFTRYLVWGKSFWETGFLPYGQNKTK